jgi:subtilisin family serine protease
MKNRLHLTWGSLLLLLALLAGGYAPVPAQRLLAWQSKVDAWVAETAASGETEFIIYLSEQADLSGAAALATKQEKGAYVYQQLVETAQRTQGPLEADLQAQGLEYRSFWIANLVLARGDLQAVQRLAERSDVAHLYANPTVHLQEPAEASSQAESAPEALEWNIAQVSADDVWALGYTGQGAVVGGQDTGYDWDHPALIDQYRGWDGSTADHNYNWHDAIHANNHNSDCGFNSPVPCDDNNHGTHTMGTMVGDDGSTNQIGMAPGARWIGCRNMEEGAGTPATYIECYQWFLAPTDLSNANPRSDLAPDVINNSWACPPGEGCTDPDVLLTVVENVRAAGILTAHSAGNSGFLGCSTVEDPAAIYDDSFTVGATDSVDAIASFSSRGPVTVDGSNRLKPDISAPGVGVRSSVRGTGYSSLSGTSMAAPHVAGLVALLISADPSLAGQVDQLEAIIRQSALPRTTSQTCGDVPGTQIPNNTYGWGRIDALAALRSVLYFVYFPVATFP